MCYYVYADHAQYTIKTYGKMALFPLILTGPLSVLYPGTNVLNVAVAVSTHDMR